MFEDLFPNKDIIQFECAFLRHKPCDFIESHDNNEERRIFELNKIL